MIIRCEAGEFKVTKGMNDIVKILGQPFAGGILVLKEHPSIQEIMESKKLPEVVVDTEAERLFIYGKDISKKSVLKGESGSDMVVVCSIRGDRLGIGLLERDKLKNLLDIGFYLRNED